jgi:hypothetical protein
MQTVHAAEEADRGHVGVGVAERDREHRVGRAADRHLAHRALLQVRAAGGHDGVQLGQFGQHGGAQHTAQRAARIALCARHRNVTGVSRGAATLRDMNLTNPFPTRPINAPRLLALGSALVWGTLELIALWRSRWTQRPK